MPPQEVRQDPNFVANEVNAYTVTILAGTWSVSLFRQMKRGTDALGGATVDESYAMTYLMGVVDMAEMCAKAAHGWSLDDVTAHIDERVEEMCMGMGRYEGKDDDEEEQDVAE